MTSEQSRAVRRMYAGWAELLRQGRMQDEEEWGDLTMEPRGVDYVETDAGGAPAMWALPKGVDPGRVLFAVHGGGYVGGSIYTHRKLYARLAKALGARALLVGYRRVPVHRHPAQLDDTTGAYTWLLGEGVRPERILFAGDSAGAALALTTQLRAREKGLPLPDATMLLSPWVDLELTGTTYETNRDSDPYFHRETVERLVEMYLGDGDRRDPLASPLHADLRGLGPIRIQVGGDETLLDDARMLERHARQCGVDVGLEVFPGQQHTFQMAAGRAPEADAALAALAEWGRSRFAR